MSETILTEEIIERGKSKNGAWSLAQVSLFGVTEFKKGWKSSIVGKYFPNSTIENFLDLKDKHLKK